MSRLVLDPVSAEQSPRRWSFDGTRPRVRIGGTVTSTKPPSPPRPSRRFPSGLPSVAARPTLSPVSEPLSAPPDPGSRVIRVTADATEARPYGSTIMTATADDASRAPALLHATSARTNDGESQDRALNHIFAAGLTVAALLGRPDVSPEIAERLGEVIDQLDMAVNAIRQTAFAARVVDDRDPHPNTPASPADIAPPERIMAVHDASKGARRHLSRFADEPFAYALHGHDFYRARDHELWAHESDGLLMSARSGTPFARRDGSVFFDLETNLPLYFEHGHPQTAPSPLEVSPIQSPSQIPPTAPHGIGDPIAR